MTHTAISLFSGAGGCSLGFAQAGFDIRLAIDHSPDAVNTYRLNFPAVPCWQRDIAAVAADEILAAVNLRPGELDFLIGGPPCQGFSSAGAKFWDDPRNALLKHYLRLLEGIRPRWFLLENVEGLLTADGGRYIYEVTRGLLAAGYHVQVHKLYGHWYGLPQERKRIFIVGTTQHADFVFPEPTYSEEATLFGLPPALSLMDAISDLPPVANDPAQTLDYEAPVANRYQQMMRAEGVHDHWVMPLNAETQARVVALKPGHQSISLSSTYCPCS
jgi:DNA (cytosine-5)-methyltransferase 1